MNKPAITFASISAALFLACSDSDSNKTTGATTEPNAIAQNSSTSQSIDDNRIKILDILDTIPAVRQPANYDSTFIDNPPEKDSTKTIHTFNSTKEVFYEDGCFINIYEDEAGVQYFYDSNEGSFISTTLIYQEEHVLLRMESNLYWSGNGDEGRARFLEECTKSNGIFREFEKGLRAIQQIACAIDIEEIPLREILENEAETYKQECIMYNEEHQEGSSCTIICSGGGGRESICDTTCPN